jgi:co-chaperonin GroES (HSP10)
MNIKSVGEKYILKKYEKNITDSGIIILSSSPKRGNLAIVVSTPKNTKYNVGDIVITNKSLVQTFGGEYQSVVESGIIAKYNTKDCKIIDCTIPRNYVLIKVTADTTEIKVADTKLYIDTTYQEQFHAPTFGEVVVCPDELIFNKDKKANNGWKDPQSMSHKTSLDIKKGDVVHFHYNCTFNAKNYELLFNEDGDDYLLTEYQNLFFADRQGEIIMLNGFISVDIPKDTSRSGESAGGIVMVDTRSSEKAKDWGKGIVKHIGTPNTDYLDWSGLDESSLDLKVGDSITFVSTKMSKFGQDMHIDNSAMKGLFRLQRKDILYVNEKS